MTANWSVTCVVTAADPVRLQARGPIRQPGSFHFFGLAGLTWIDWGTVLGLVLTVAGFGITWWQLQRTQTAREAVSDTLGHVNAGKAHDNLVKSVPALRRVYDRVVTAAETRDASRLGRLLVDWSRECSRTIANLEQLAARKARMRRSAATDTTEDVAIRKFRSALSMVEEAQWKLGNGGAATDLKSEIKYALAAMRECLIEAEQLLEGRKFERAS
jgi:hypothetical protein